MSVDPLVDQTGQSYAYAGDDPIDNTDPSGQWKVCLGGHCVQSHHFDPRASLDAAVNIGRGATFGLTDKIANAIVPGASCTVSQNSLDQFIGRSATGVLTAGGLTGIARWGALKLPYATADGLLGFGETDPLGNILVDSNLEGDVLRQTLLHEAVHSFYTRVLGTTISQATYSTAAGKVAEEWVAETFATGRPIAALKFALGYLGA